MGSTKTARTFVTPQQATIHSLFVKHRSMSEVARMLSITQIRVREALVQYERNRMRDRGLSPPTLREMMRGDVTTRFGVPRIEFGGRPAKHRQGDLGANAPSGGEMPRHAPATARGPVAKFVVTSAEAGHEVNQPFWRNLKAFAGHINAEVVVLRKGSEGLIGPNSPDVRAHVWSESAVLGGLVDLAADVRVLPQSVRPLDSLRARRDHRWTLFPHGAIQLETLPRVREGGLRMHMTTGSITEPAAGNAFREGRNDFGAVVVEIASDGACFCRHLTTQPGGGCGFQDLDIRVDDGRVRSGVQVEALTFGDVHHARMDPRVAAATWGIGPAASSFVGVPLIDALRPKALVFHDICDFSARSHHDARNSHNRFALMVARRDCVRAELAAVAKFLAATRREWAESFVVHSNHHDALVRWLREADFRLDPVNALFFLEASLALHRRLAAGGDSHGFFEEVMRGLSGEPLSRVHFLRPDQSLDIAGVENAVHGHRSTDGKRGGMAALEALGIRLTIGHTHRPATRGGLCSVGVCQERLDYARGPLTSWAIGHVATYADGARQHLIFDRGRFRA